MMIMNNGHELSFNSDIPYGQGQGIALEPFLHQVAGRATLMCLNETTVCKPLNYQEHFFYKSLPPDILQFTPRFKGVINVNIEERADGTIALTAHPYHQDNDEVLSDDKANILHDTTERDEMLCNQQTSKCALISSPYRRIRLKQTGSLSVDVNSDGLQNKEEGKSLSSSLLVNPWIYKVHKEGLRRQLKSRQRVVQKCILLENVASKFRRPCVLDLKMGTRIHGDHDDDEKKQRHEQKSAATTTQKLGVRLSGMQVFDPDSGKYNCRDKYFGRKLDRAGLLATLQQFFFDGRGTRHDLLRPVLCRLRSIRDSLKRLRTFRFYSSSLLIMYDGDSSTNFDNVKARSKRCDVLCKVDDSLGRRNCLIDGFGLQPQITNQTSVSSITPCSDDCRELCISSTSDFSWKQDSHQCSLKCSDCKVVDACAVTRLDQEDRLPRENRPCLACACRTCQSQVRDSDDPVQFDIRMIDFAKSTHRDMDSSVIHDGPDHGYIFGLTNLIEILKEIFEGKNELDAFVCDR